MAVDRRDPVVVMVSSKYCRSKRGTDKMRGGCEGERESVGRTEQEALFKDAPPFPLEVCPSGGPGDW